MVLEERRVPGRGRTVRDRAGGYDTQVSYSRWESCGLQQGSKISAPGSASAGDGQTVPGGALAQGSLRATESGFSLRVDSLALSISPHPKLRMSSNRCLDMVDQKEVPFVPNTTLELTHH